MVIEISNGVYTKGHSDKICEISEPGLLESLNKIIDWGCSLFPPKPMADNNELWEENRDFLGNPPQLKKGSVFKFGNQLIGIEDENTMVLVMSETGYYGLKRVWDTKIKVEMGLAFDDYLCPESIEDVEKISRDDIPEGWETARIKYDTMKIITDRIVPGREDLFGGDGVKLTLNSNVIPYPVHLYVLSGGYAYDPSELDSDMANGVITNELLHGLYHKYSRIKTELGNPYENRNNCVLEAKKTVSEITKKLEESVLEGTTE